MRLSERYPFNVPLTPGTDLLGGEVTERDGWGVSADGVLVRIDIHGDTPWAGYVGYGTPCDYR